MAKQDDGLFLFEVLVDKIIFSKSPCFSDKDFRTCINIECPSVEPLEICDDDPGACVATSGGPFVKNFNNGKSCLFSLKQADISKAMSNFPIKISVYKSLPCGCLPTKIILGEATIDMTKEFIEARKNFLDNPTNVSYQALKDSFRIVGTDGEETGEVLMFLRISCFGKLIVTRFQGGSDPPKLGSAGGKGPNIIDRSCNPKKDFQTQDDPCACGVARMAASRSTLREREFGVYPVAVTPNDQQNIPPMTQSAPPPLLPMSQMACRNTDQYCLHIPKGRTKQFEEIGTSVGGNELKIKVPATTSIIKKISQTHCAMQCPFFKKADGEPCKPPCGKNQISLALPAESICCHGAPSADTQFTCTTEGCIQSSKHGQQAHGDDKSQQQLNINRDVFVLKVAKTAMEGDAKCKLELELVTPKGGDKPIKRQQVNQRIQSDPDCKCCVITKPKKTKPKRHR